MEELHVSCAAEGDYVAHQRRDDPLAARARAAATGLRVHYLHGPGLPGPARSMLADMVEAPGPRSPSEVADREVAGCPASTSSRSAMWYRIFLPELLPDRPRALPRLDTIACESVAPLWETPLDGC